MNNRKNIYEWDSPRWFPPERGFVWYNPIDYIRLAAELLLICWWFLWHRFQSVKARRADIVWSLRSICIMLDSMERGECTKAEKDNIQQIKQYVGQIADEMNIQDEQLESRLDD
jgi:hypothetical protein